MFIKIIFCLKMFFVTYLIMQIICINCEKLDEPENNSDYYVNLIHNEMNKAKEYNFPKNSKAEYEAEKDTVESYGEVDFVVIGGGSGGTVMANRLSEIESWNVLLLEAGAFENNFTNIPAMCGFNKFSPYNWGYNSTVQKYSCLGMVDKKCPIPRGKGLGGSTLLNGLIYSRANPKDFDKWEKLGNPGWSYKDVLPYFKKSENFYQGNSNTVVDDQVHGNDGPLHVQYFHPDNNPHKLAFIAANKELGFKNVDYNSGTGLGAGWTQQNTLNGTRFDGGRAYVHPVLHRKNLKVLTEAFVYHIHISNDLEAEAVYFTHQKKNFKVMVKNEIILSAGSINSAQLLMLAGIGPEKHLNSLKIPLKKNLNVGTELYDHPGFFGLNFNSNIIQPNESIDDLVKQYLQGKGILTAVDVNNQALGFYESSYTRGKKLPDIEIMLNPTPFPNPFLQQIFGLSDELFEDVFGNVNTTTTFSMYVMKLHAKSSGTVKLKSSDPFEFPLVDLNLLSAEEDINVMYEAIQFVLKLIDTEAFKKIEAVYAGKQIRACKTKKYMSKDYWICFLRQMGQDIFHPMGTCRMGPNPGNGAVVDHKCRVHGVKKLRVVDASVFPFAFAGHPNANIVMIGEKISDDIKKDYGKL